MSDPLSPEPDPEWKRDSEPNGGAAISDSDGQLKAVPDRDAVSTGPADARMREPRADESRVAGHCLWPAIEVSGPDAAQLRFRQRPKVKPPLSAVLPTVPMPPAAPVQARNAAESSSSTGVFERVPSGVHPAAEPGSRASDSSGRISSRFLAEPSAKRRDPRAATPATLPQVRPVSRSNDALATWMRRGLYAIIALSIASVVAMVGIRLQEDARIEADAVVKPPEKSVDIAVVRERMSRLESECAANKALIRKQETELKGMHCDMTEFERSRMQMNERLINAKTP
jgi:hypothetical protein